MGTLCVLFVVRITIYIVLLAYENKARYVSNSHTYIELFYVLAPSVIAIVTLRPIILRIYLFEECFYTSIKTIERRQWYWVEYLTSQNFNIRVNHRINLFTQTAIPVVVRRTASDVIHNLRINSRLLKIDCYPRRINCSKYYTEDLQPRTIRWCSELCRINHSFIPFLA